MFTRVLFRIKQNTSVVKFRLFDLNDNILYSENSRFKLGLNLIQILYTNSIGIIDKRMNTSNILESDK